MFRGSRWVSKLAAVWVGCGVLCGGGVAGAATSWHEEAVSGEWATTTSLAQAGDRVWASAFAVTPDKLESRMLQRERGQWTSVAVPDIGRLGQVSAGSADDVWALSQDSNQLLHLTGSSWQVVRPTSDASVVYSGIAQFGSDVWLAGSRWSSNTTSVGVVQRRQGQRWVDVPLPDVAPNWQLSQITGTSGHDLWAIGVEFRSTTDQQTVALHYDGSTWRKVDSPTGPGRSFVILSAKAFGSHDVWMVGTASSAEDGSANHPFAAVFDGYGWTEQKITGDRTRLSGVTKSGDRVLVVGYQLTTPASPFAVTKTAGTGTWSAAALPATPAGSPGYQLFDALTLRDGSVLLLGNADQPSTVPDGDPTWRPYAARGRI